MIGEIIMSEEIKVEELKEEVKEEIKQTNFRIKQDDADKFRKLCEELGINQAQGFSHLIQVIELNQAKETLTGQTTSIEEFEMHVKSIMNGYMQALELNANAEARAKESFISQLESKDKSIMDYQAKLEKEKEKVTALEEKLKEYDVLKKNQAVLESELASKSQQIADKDNIINMKNEKLDAAEEKVQAYDQLLKEKQDVDAELATVKTQLKEAYTEMNQQLALASVISDKEKAEAIQAEKDDWSEKFEKLREKMQDEKDALQEQLRNDEKAAHQLEQQLREEILKLTQELNNEKIDKEKLQNETDKKIEKMSRNYNELQTEFTAYKKQNPSK